MKNILKKNQIIIYTFALMLVAAGYLNYTSKPNENSVQTSVEEVADIGDATLVNSNDIVPDENSNELNANETSKDEQENKETNKDNNTNITNANSNATINTNADATQENYFEKSKLERETMYSQMLESYEKILNSSNSLETQKQSATQEITKINQIKNSIMICENLLKTKGFKNSIVFVNGDSISVIIEAESLKQEETAQIQNIVSRELNAKIENIHIATK